MSWLPELIKSVLVGLAGFLKVVFGMDKPEKMEVNDAASLMIFAALMLICSMNSACTIGPQVKTEFVIVRTGRPLEILENVTVRARRLEDETVARQDIGGWVCMPRDHWEAVRRALEKKSAGS